MQFFKRLLLRTFVVASLAAPLSSIAQEAVKFSVHSGESFIVHSGETVGIFSDVVNSGTIGSHENSLINFSGQRWINNASGKIGDESPGGLSGQGGVIKFISASNSLQFIDSRNNTQGSFTNITLANSGNVMLEGEDITIRKNLNFESGHLILNNSNAVLAESSRITGYGDDRFIVTGTGTSGGFLVRSTSPSQQSDLVFPIGTTVNSYTPALISYKGVAQEIKVRVFDNVYDKAVFGVPYNGNYVPKTWNISYTSTDPLGTFTLSTQHNANEEGSTFASSRANSFISRFNSTTESWDRAPSTGVSQGTITSGSPIANAYVNTRLGIPVAFVNEYFAKSTTVATPTAGLRIPAGISPNNDGLNDKFVIEHVKAGDRVRLDIYNRWQTLVFRDGDYKNTFDGIGNQKGSGNAGLPDGTYYYILNINSEKPITGHIIINR